jgi:hypothetical protein
LHRAERPDVRLDRDLTQLDAGRQLHVEGE